MSSRNDRKFSFKVQRQIVQSTNGTCQFFPSVFRQFVIVCGAALLVHVLSTGEVHRFLAETGKIVVSNDLLLCLQTSTNSFTCSFSNESKMCGSRAELQTNSSFSCFFSCFCYLITCCPFPTDPGIG